MREPKKRASGGPAPEATAGTGGVRADPQTQRLLKLGKAVGNDEVLRRLDTGTAKRDTLMDFVIQRLGAMRGMQLLELSRHTHFGQREFWRKIADTHKPEHTKPEPTRYREAAHLYKKAAEQLAKGHLADARRTVESAMAADQRAIDELPEYIKDGEYEVDCGPEAPGALGEIVPNEACGERPVPEGVDLADDIMNVTTEFRDPPSRKRVRDPWWTEEEEEEEEGEAAGGGGS